MLLLLPSRGERMISRKLMQRKMQELQLGGEGEEDQKGAAKLQEEGSPKVTVVDHPQLSLGPSVHSFADSSSSKSQVMINNSRKRKQAWDDPLALNNIELNLNDHLPLDWEQYLDLQSGRMYYLNKKTMNKSWSRPKELKLDLELNISTSEAWPRLANSEQLMMKSNISSGGSMIAVACSNCHLLVMLCRSSPSCPNCKFMHSTPAQQLPPPAPARRVDSVKSLVTLSLLN